MLYALLHTFTKGALYFAPLLLFCYIIWRIS